MKSPRLIIVTLFHDNLYPWCAEINYPRLAGHDKSYTGRLTKIFDLIVSYNPELDF